MRVTLVWMLLLAITVSQHKQILDPEAEATKWNFKYNWLFV